MPRRPKPPSPVAEHRPRVAADLAADVQRVREHARQMVRELGLLATDRRGLSISGCHVLIELSLRGGLSGGQLAGLLNLDKSTMSRVLQPLARRRLVRAAVANADRRGRYYELTSAGAAHVVDVHAGADEQVRGALTLLSPQERAATVRGIEIYVGALRRARLRQGVIVRPIARRDNIAVAAVIRTVLPEFGASGPGFAIMDPEVDDMHGAYRSPAVRDRAAYFVAERDGMVLGGAGIAPLSGAPKTVCELRKMYLTSAARGFGIGQALLDAALEAAARLGYRRCYLETLSHMQQARALYEKNGFTRHDGRMGNTGHFGCNTFYLRKL